MMKIIQMAEATVPPTNAQPTRLRNLAGGGFEVRYHDIANMGKVAIGIVKRVEKGVTKTKPDRMERMPQ